MTETYNLLKSIIDSDKELYYNILDHHLNHVVPIITGDNKSYNRSQKSNVDILKLKIESSDYNFSSDELSFLLSVLRYHTSELMAGVVKPLSDEQMEERLDLLDPIYERIEDTLHNLKDY